MPKGLECRCGFWSRLSWSSRWFPWCCWDTAARCSCSRCSLGFLAPLRPSSPRIPSTPGWILWRWLVSFAGATATAHACFYGLSTLASGITDWRILLFCTRSYIGRLFSGIFCCRIFLFCSISKAPRFCLSAHKCTACREYRFLQNFSSKWQLYCLCHRSSKSAPDPTRWPTCLANPPNFLFWWSEQTIS